jgi:hypothetical protein
MKTLGKVFFALLCFFLLISEMKNAAAPFLSRSIVRLKIKAATHNPMRPWNMNVSEFRSGQAIAVGPYELLAIASQIKNHQLIQIQTASRSDLLEVKVKIVDYDLNLCLLSVDPKALSVPFLPLSLKIPIKIGEPIQCVWLTEDQRFLKTAGRLVHADAFFSSRSQTGFLQFIISSESFPGGYSEAVLQGNKIIGLIQKVDSDKKISSMLPASLMQSFLKKTRETSEYPGVPKVGFQFMPLSDKITRAYLKLPPEEKRGVVISDIYDFGSGGGDASTLKKNDVLLKWGNFDVDSKGAILLGSFGKLSFWSLLSEASLGSTVPCIIWREGALLKIPVLLKGFSSDTLPIPYQSLDRALPYFFLGGYLFQELSLPLLDAFGAHWDSHLDPALKKLVDEHRFHSIPGKNRIVLMTQVLPHPINQGYQHLNYKIVNAVNGISIQGLKELQALLSQAPTEEYLRIELDEHSPDILIPTKDLASTNLEIKNLYSVP